MPFKQESQPIDAVLLAAIEAETDADRRSEALDRLAESVSDADLAATLGSLVRAGSPAADELSQLLARRWAERDRAGAAEWATQLPEGPRRCAALGQVAVAWANTDLPAAVQWLHTLSESESKQSATRDLAYEAARNEPLTALKLAVALPPGAERDDLLVHAISQWAAADSAVATAWALEVPDSNLRQRLLAAVTVARAEQDGSEAAILAANALAAGSEQDRAVVAIVQRWAQRSPEAAASWLAQFPDIPARVPAVQNLLAIWMPQDAGAVKNWVDDLPGESFRTMGTSFYSQFLAERGSAAPALVPESAYENSEK
jgi:hypothetical protein